MTAADWEKVALLILYVAAPVVVVRLVLRVLRDKEQKMTASDAQYADHPMNPYYEYDTTAAAERQRRAEQVADRHFRRQSPEFCEFVADGRYPADFWGQLVAYTSSGEAHKMQIARGMAETVKDDWRCYVCNFPNDLETEIRQEP